jgi:hypothetical protein
MIHARLAHALQTPPQLPTSFAPNCTEQQQLAAAAGDPEKMSEPLRSAFNHVSLGGA